MDIQSAIRAVIDNSASIAVVPWPDSDDEQPWWLSLLTEDAERPRVVARLPFTVGGEAGDGPVALAVGCLPFAPTGEDSSLVAVELTEAVSRSRLKEGMEANGLAPTAFWNAVRLSDRQLVQLVEFDGFVDDDDPRLSGLLAGLESLALGARPIGGFARPIRLDGTGERP